MTSDGTAQTEYRGHDSWFRGDRDERRSGPLSMSTVFELLSERRRRYALYHLIDTDGPVDFDALVAQIVDWETGDLRPPRGHEARVTASLHHLHLPRFEEAGVATYDAAAGTVRYLGSEKIESQLSEIKKSDLP
jgi:hypothetical protein